MAVAFGTKQTALYPLVEPFALGEARMVDDRALMCCDGPSLPLDSQHFSRPDTGHRSSPWFKVGALRLHTVDSARERYRVWAFAEWEKIHSGPRDQVLGSDGQYHELPAPPNPYRQKVNAK